MPNLGQTSQTMADLLRFEDFKDDGFDLEL